MSFGHSIRVCLRGWVTFTGRAPRAEYWPFVLFAVAAVVPAQLALSAVLVAAVRPAALVLAALLVLATVVLGVASVSGTVRRLHDRNVSGWWVAVAVALAFLDLAINTGGIAGGFGLVIKLAGAGGGVALLVQTLLRGSDGTNAFGPDPLARRGGGAVDAAAVSAA